jgi:hypothetical protein
MTISVHAHEWHITSKGEHCAVVFLDRDCERVDLLKLFERVEIDGKEYEVKGVESDAVPTLRNGAGLLLMIKGQR